MISGVSKLKLHAVYLGRLPLYISSSRRARAVLEPPYGS